MITPELTSYITSQVNAGVSRAAITEILKKTGWTDMDISEAFAELYPEPTSPVQENVTITQTVTLPTEPVTQPVETFQPTIQPEQVPVDPVVTTENHSPETSYFMAQPTTIYPVQTNNTTQPETAPIQQPYTSPIMNTPREYPMNQVTYASQQTTTPVPEHHKKITLVIIFILVILLGAVFWFLILKKSIPNITSIAKEIPTGNIGEVVSENINIISEQGTLATNTLNQQTTAQTTTEITPTIPASVIIVEKTDSEKTIELTAMHAYASWYKTMHKDFNGFCESGTEASPLPTTTTCRSRTSTWSASRILSNGKYFCIDNSGFSGEISYEPTKTACSAK